MSVNSVDSGIPLAEQSRMVPFLGPHGSATVFWQVGVPLDVVAGDYRIVATVDRANASLVSTVYSTVTTTVAPVIAGGTTTLTLASSAAAPLDVRWSAVVPEGISLSPSSGTVVVAAGGSASVRITATGTADPGVAAVPISVSSGRFGLGGASLLVSVPYPDLGSAFNNVGITDDGDVNPADLDGGIDGDGSSLSAQALAAAGAVAGKAVAAGGFSFAWPSSATPDNVAADGQTIVMGGSGERLGLLVTASYVAPGTFNGAVTVNYSDGSTAAIALAVPEWQRGYTAPADEVITMPYHNYGPVGQITASTHVFLVSGAIDPAKTIASITLPPAGANRATLHVFAVSSS